MKTFVIDASTALKWVLEDEDHTDEARQVLKSHLSHKITLIAPDLWAYEVASALQVATTRRRLSRIKAKKLLTLLMEAQPALVAMDTIITECLATAFRFKISVYDSLYLTLALSQKITLLTADRKLIDKTHQSKYIFYIGNWGIRN